MHAAAATAVTKAVSVATHSWDRERSPHLHLISSHRERFTPITGFTLDMDVSSITPVWRTDCGAVRWKRFLSSVLLRVTASGFDMTRDASVAAKSWNGRARASANAATGS